ncbi:phosphotransferase enzyme family protein [Histoplasma capsulatum H143]|uniref:Phosphotransferase enzyme family protein n=1 Tax=Ajellomyces capsulatus (strain H143) TaxID=544712 RepID=C6HMI6_AJECH|nr:phosphotransferase enzyme family protein [Histoplasma capsulatum H143]
MDWDQLAEEKLQKVYAGWLKLLLQNSPALPLKLATQHRPGFQATRVSDFTTGSFNMCSLGNGLIARHTSIPILTVLGTGKWSCGPYIVTTVIEDTLLSRCLQDPSVLAPSLNPKSDLEITFSGMAQIVLELSKLVFKYIGGLKWDSGKLRVSKQPLTLNMNELVHMGNFPFNKFVDCNHIFASASGYFQQLTEQQFLHLKYQHNDAITNEDDCRKKYSSLKITGVIDWEYTYVAPAEFTYSASWWLLFKSPEAWDLNNFMDQYCPRLKLFLEVLRVHEDEQIRQGSLRESQHLSDRMALSIEDGLFWFCLAARKSFMFDEIYWTYLDEQYFGPLSSLDDRLSLLTHDEQNQMEDFVRAKVQQKEERRLDEHQTFDEVFDLLSMKSREAKSNFAVIAAAEQLCDGEGCYLCRHPARIRGGRRKFLAWKTQHSYCDNIIRQLENRRKDAAWEYTVLEIDFTRCNRLIEALEIQREVIGY